MTTPLPARRRPEDYLLAGAVLLLALLVALNWAAFAWMLVDVGWRSWLIPGMTMLAAVHFAIQLLVAPRRLSKVSAAVTGAGVFLLIVAQATHMIEVYS